MSESEIIECSQVIYDFIQDETDISLFNNFNDIPIQKKMNETLRKYNTDIIPFTEYINKEYNIYPDPFWKNFSAREFFSTTKALDFYKTILRDLKLKSCLS